MSAGTVPEEAHRSVDQLPGDATGEDLQYQIYVGQSIGAGLAEANAARLVSVNEVKRQFGLAT